MHHGQNMGEAKKQIKQQQRELYKIGGTFFNCAEIGWEIYIFGKYGRICIIYHWRMARGGDPVDP